jgi:hypothetical protein
MFNLDLINFAKQLIPNGLKKPILIAYINVLVGGMSVVRDDFYNTSENTKNSIRITSQKIILKKWLNDKFGTSTINVIDGAWKDLEFDFYPTEIFANKFEQFPAEGLSINPNYSWFISEFTDDDDFIVEIPSSISARESEVMAEVNKYKFADKKYSINII